MTENINIPDAMPTLAAGAHNPGDGKACVMEYVSMLAGEQWSDHPTCTHPMLAQVARNVNDSLADRQRNLLVPLIGRLFGTTENGEAVQLRLTMALLNAMRMQAMNLSHGNHFGAMAAHAYAQSATPYHEVPDATLRRIDDMIRMFVAGAGHSMNTSIAVGEAMAVLCYHFPPFSRVAVLSQLIDAYDEITGRKADPVPDTVLVDLAAKVTAGV